MTHQEVNGHKFVFYDDEETMPMALYQKFQKYLMKDGGVGSTLTDFDSHMKKVYQLLQKKMVEEAATELENTRIGVFSALEEVNYTHLSTACCVKSVNGQDWEDYSESGLAELVKLMSKAGYTHGMAKKLSSEVKKK
jgi:hypothetical protein